LESSVLAHFRSLVDAARRFRQFAVTPYLERVLSRMFQVRRYSSNQQSRRLLRLVCGLFRIAPSSEFYSEWTHAILCMHECVTDFVDVSWGGFAFSS